MYKITSTSITHCGGSVTRLTGSREYFDVGLTAAFPATDPVNRAADPPSNSYRIYFMFVTKCR
ncbi:hypothetical protein [Methylotuvimicrobium sp.]|uniref:hypothetical protein n=1 Tax=Methylotuvimicrobium sp. TaxID=2822413 RepID=UPI003D647D29